MAPANGQQQQLSPSTAAPGQVIPQSNGSPAAGDVAVMGGGGDGSSISEVERLRAMRKAIAATDGSWSSGCVNQETGWNVPSDPEPAGDGSGTPSTAWRPHGGTNSAANNGTDHWHSAMRNGGAGPHRAADPQWSGAAPPPPQPHIPQSNIGGTWGEDDEPAQPMENMWSSAPTGQWGGNGGTSSGGGPGMWNAVKKDGGEWRGEAPWDAGSGLRGDSWSRGQPQLPQRPGGMPRGGAAGMMIPPHLLSRMPPDVKPAAVLDAWMRQQQGPRPGWGEPPPPPAGPPPLSGWPDDKWSSPQHQQQPDMWAKPPTQMQHPWADANPALDWQNKMARGGGMAGMHSGKPQMYDKCRGLDEPADLLMMRAGGGLDDMGMPSTHAHPAVDWRTGGDHSLDNSPFSSIPPPLHAQGMKPTHQQQMFRQQQQQQQPLRYPTASQPQPPQQPQQQQQLRPLINQIQMAIHAGHLNPAVLQQPMSPQTLVLLNHLLQQIKTLDQLSRPVNQQQQLTRGSPAAMHQLQMEVLRVKNNISQIQSQIATQQQVKPTAGPHGIVAAAGMLSGNKPPGPELHGITANMSDMNLRDSGMPQSRLNQWKLGTPADRMYGQQQSDCLVGEFARAPGPSAVRCSPPSLLSSSMMAGGDPTWSSSAAPAGELSWPSDPSQHPAPTPRTADWNPAGAGYADLVPEFQPGKPWKLKTMEDELAGPSTTSSTSASAGDHLLMSQHSKSDGMRPSVSESTWSYNPSSGKSSGDWGARMGGAPPGMSAASSSGSSVWPSGGSAFAPWNSAAAPTPSHQPAGSPAQLQHQSANNVWLLLRNLTAQIDASTLKTLCVQHGQLQAFHVYLNQGVALVRYSTREQTTKARLTLNSCVFGNTTIMAELVTDDVAAGVVQRLSGPSCSAPPAAAAVSVADVWSNDGPGVGGMPSAASWSSGVMAAPSSSSGNDRGAGGRFGAVWSSAGATSALGVEDAAAASSTAVSSAASRINQFLPDGLL